VLNVVKYLWRYVFIALGRPRSKSMDQGTNDRRLEK
jgi:hypothetical protein